MYAYIYMYIYICSQMKITNMCVCVDIYVCMYMYISYTYMRILPCEYDLLFFNMIYARLNRRSVSFILHTY